ncbi:MAG: tol-pal system protein YbgF [Proteobacteria bacterium]|nr:tol-pal system protein YbgF [Pseudomonadota bacterium]
MAKFAQIFRGCLRFQVVALACALTTAPVLAQTKDARAAKAGAAVPAAASADAGLKSRVEALEEQLVDMQVVVGTLESLAKNGGGAAPAFASSGGGADAARIDSLETQVRALTAQVQQLSDQIRSMGGTPRRSDIETGTDTASNGAGSPDSPAVPGFGSTTVSSGNGGNDAIGGLLNNQGQAGAGAGSPPAAAVATAALPAANEISGDPKQAYETAYGYLLQRDYGSAETAFTDFLKKFPNDSLSGNAQYWLGETYFVRGQYKAAASAFLKGYQTYSQSGKAADSLLKLAMSLDRLGQKDAACSSFAELSTKFPTAPQSVKARAQSERQRVGCQ